MASRRGLLTAILTFSTLVTAGCDLIGPGLTPARKLEATWTTAVPVQLFYQTNYCGGYQNVAT